jgi:hypothetical protein
MVVGVGVGVVVELPQPASNSKPMAKQQKTVSFFMFTPSFVLSFYNSLMVIKIAFPGPGIDRQVSP